MQGQNFGGSCHFTGLWLRLLLCTIYLLSVCLSVLLFVLLLVLLLSCTISFIVLSGLTKKIFFFFAGFALLRCCCLACINRSLIGRGGSRGGFLCACACTCVYFVWTRFLDNCLSCNFFLPLISLIYWFAGCRKYGFSPECFSFVALRGEVVAVYYSGIIIYWFWGSLCWVVGGASESL